MINTEHYIFEEESYNAVYDETIMYFLKDDHTRCVVVDFPGKTPDYHNSKFRKEILTKNVDDCLEAANIIDVDISEDEFDKLIALARKAK